MLADTVNADFGREKRDAANTAAGSGRPSSSGTSYTLVVPYTRPLRGRFQGFRRFLVCAFLPVFACEEKGPSRNGSVFRSPAVNRDGENDYTLPFTLILLMLKRGSPCPMYRAS